MAKTLSAKKFGTKSFFATSEASSACGFNQFTTFYIINVPLCKTICQKCLSYHTRWKEYCEINIAYDSPTVEKFLNFFTELFNEGASL